MNWNITILILIAVFFGWAEQFAMQRGFQPWNIKWLCWFKVKGIIVPYHILLVAVESAVCIAFGEWQFIPAFCVCQDWGWFRFHPATLNEYNWVNLGLGGIRMDRQWWLPYSYILGVGLSILLYAIFKERV
jgi:hypothetical protein